MKPKTASPTRSVRSIMYVDQSEDGTVYAIGFHEMYMIYVSSRDISTEDLKTILHEMHRIE